VEGLAETRRRQGVSLADLARRTGVSFRRLRGAELNDVTLTPQESEAVRRVLDVVVADSRLRAG